jgi:DDE superfamily endonuclease
VIHCHAPWPQTWEEARRLQAWRLKQSGQTPILREWWTGDHLSAVSAVSPEGKLYLHCQDRAINVDGVVAFLERLLREVPGQTVIIWDGAPIHRSHLIKKFLARRLPGCTSLAL